MRASSWDTNVATRRTIKSKYWWRAGLGALVLTAAFLLSRPAEPRISGKPISHWVDRLSDLDNNVRLQATSKLRWAEPNQLERYRSKIQQAAPEFAAEKFAPETAGEDP